MKIKSTVKFEQLKQYGFHEDETNCDDPEDHYYRWNNWYKSISDDFRITVNTLDRHIDILCLAKEAVLYNIFDLDTLQQLFENDVIEHNTK